MGPSYTEAIVTVILIKKLLPILNDLRNIKPANNFVDKKN
jgi:hypothetical protein